MFNPRSFTQRPVFLIAGIGLAAICALTTLAGPNAYAANERSNLSDIIETSSQGGQRISLEIGQSLTLDIPKGVRTIYVGEPSLIDTSLKSASQLSLAGRSAGMTDLILQREDGTTVVSYRVFVKRNMANLHETLRLAAPQLNLRIQTTGRGIVLTGDVNSEAEALRIEQIIRATLSADELSGFVNQLTIREPDQVMIKLTIAEVQHSILKQLGIKTTGSWTIGNTGFRGTGSTGIADGVGTIAANVGGKELFSIQALEREGVLRTLAEPVLTAVSGGEAKFTAGGQIPILGSFNYAAGVATRSVTYKDVGVELAFKPVVISPGKIRLTITSVVNELDPSLSYTFDGISYPGFRKRNMDTVVELPSGASLMTAGLLQQQTSTQIQGVPALLNIPVIGALFRSREFQRKETELMIVVMPFIAKTNKPDKLPLPTDAFRLNDEATQILQNQMVQKYGMNKSADNTQGQAAPKGVGFITK